MGAAVNISKIIFFRKCKQIKLRLVIFLFRDPPACFKKADILPLTTTLIAHLRNQFNYVFALLIPMPRFKTLIFAKIGLKLSCFGKKIAKSSSTGGKAWGRC